MLGAGRIAVAWVALACACSPARRQGGGDAPAGRPYRLDVPRSYAAGRPAPLLLLLHGYGGTGARHLEYSGLAPLAASRGVLVAVPDGTPDRDGRRFWNATDACCDLHGTGVDDVAYLADLIDDVRRRYDVDPRRVWVVGHSNGGFMAHRLACERAARVAAVVSLAGGVWKDAARCAPDRPVAVLQVHGDRDAAVPYGGGRVLGVGGEAPPAAASIATWAARNGCAGGDLAPSGARLDLDARIAGAETRVERFACAAGAAELWTIEGGGHVPSLRAPAWAEAVLDWLEAHAR